MKIAVYGQTYAKESSQKAFSALAKELKMYDADIYVESEFLKLQDDSFLKSDRIKSFTVLDKSFDLLVSIGGDGTILRAITFVRDYNIPIIGINTGRLGFLATVQTEDIPRIFPLIFERKYKISERTLLSVKTVPANSEIEAINFAFNEVAVSRKNTTSMITVETHLNDEYLTSYWADGLILSTPTGSTGYSLSCGGPVIAPDAKNFVLTPIAPHNLSARPLVIPDTTAISFKIDGREDHFLMSLDSRIVTLPNSTTVYVNKADFTIKMIELPHETFLDTLRKKLLWGEDRRN
jgi:NAD+ kinase